MTDNNSLLSASETAVGLMLNGKQSAQLFNPDKFHGKYSSVVKDIIAGKTEEELYSKYTNLIQAAKHAAHSVNGLGTELDWVQVVNEAYATEVVIDSLQKSIKYFTLGDRERASDLLRRATSTLGNSSKMRSISADEVAETYTPFIKSVLDLQCRLGWRGMMLQIDWPEDAKDLNELYVKYGLDTVSSLLENAKRRYDYELA